MEIRPSIKWDKGDALEFLLESLGYANSNDVLPIYIGDDRTDEDAFKVLSFVIIFFNLQKLCLCIFLKNNIIVLTFCHGK